MSDDPSSKALPSKFELIVLGTGLTESLVAAAASRVGHSVLHLDSDPSYGHHWAGFNLNQFREWITSQRDDTPVGPDKSLPKPANGSMPLSEDPIYRNITEVLPDGRTELDPEIEKLSRRFGIDLVPNVIYSSGPMVDILVQSNISRYLEFKATTRILNGSLDATDEPVEDSSARITLTDVPCSRTDIFNSANVSLVEKRSLMKFMKTCIAFPLDNPDDRDVQQLTTETLCQFLDREGLTSPQIRSLVCNVIAMSAEESVARDAVGSIQLFVNSLGRFGNSPFLFPLYGTGEFPQAFSRLCAVFGGTYFLNANYDGMNVGQDNRISSILVNGQEIECDHLVAPVGMFADSGPENRTSRWMSRAVFITSKSIKESIDKENGDEITFARVRFPSCNPTVLVPVSVLEVGYSVAVAPKGYYVLYMWSELPEEDQQGCPTATRNFFSSVLNSLFGPADVPATHFVHWSCFYDQKCCYSDSSQANHSSKWSNLSLVAPPTGGLDYSGPISEARRIFAGMFPGEEFLPRAPDPDEIDMEATMGITQSGDDSQDQDKETVPESVGQEHEDHEEQEGREPEIPTATQTTEQ